MSFNYFFNNSVLGAYKQSGDVTSVTDITSSVINTARGSSILWTTVGSHNWTVPAGVTSICIVLVGGGGGGMYYQSTSSGLSYAMNGGGGGGLLWMNNIGVSPGATYLISVGGGGNGGTYSNSSVDGTLSYLGHTNGVTQYLKAFGGSKGRYSQTSSGGWSQYDPASAISGGLSFPNPGFQYGGTTGGYAVTSNSSGYGPSGGGGAGGYGVNPPAFGPAGDYNQGQSTSFVTGGGGSTKHGGLALPNAWAGVNGAGGGGSYGVISRTSGGGGGVGMYGRGADGARGDGSVTNGGGGGGGSGGQDGGPGLSSSANKRHGGLYGGGGGGASSMWWNTGNTYNTQDGKGGDGAVRILIGDGRGFPDTNTGLIGPETVI